MEDSKSVIEITLKSVPGFLELGTKQRSKVVSTVAALNKTLGKLSRHQNAAVVTKEALKEDVKDQLPTRLAKRYFRLKMGFEEMLSEDEPQNPPPKAKPTFPFDYAPPNPSGKGGGGGSLQPGSTIPTPSVVVHPSPVVKEEASWLKARRERIETGNKNESDFAYERNCAARDAYRAKMKQALEATWSSYKSFVESGTAEETHALINEAKDGLVVSRGHVEIVLGSNKYREGKPDWNMPMRETTKKRVNYILMFLRGTCVCRAYLTKTFGDSDVNHARDLYVSMGVTLCCVTRNLGKIGDFVLHNHNIEISSFIRWMSYTFEGIDTAPDAMTVNRHAISCCCFASNLRGFDHPFAAWTPLDLLQKDGANLARTKAACIRVDEYLTNAEGDAKMKFADALTYNTEKRVKSRPYLFGLELIYPDAEECKVTAGMSNAQLAERYQNAITTQDLQSND